ncbi:MAG: hypothetical protein WKF36_09705 [Candidatus Nitrosocosmicus sp.]
MNKINLFAILSIAAAAASLFGGMVTPVIAQDNMTMGMDNMSMPMNNTDNMTMGMDMDNATNMTTMQ